MTSNETATCQACGWHGPVEDTLELRDVWDRVLPGDVMPAGECPLEGCRGAAMLDDRFRRRDDLRPAMAALMTGPERLPEGMPAGAALQPVCNACGSNRVLVDAWAAWDTAAQRWELHSTYEPTAICCECDTESSYSMKPVPRTPA